MSRRFGKLDRRITRRCIGLLVLIGLCALQVPLSLPVPATSSGKDRSAPFPCQDRPCGCSSAARCWNDCCCFTNQQKLDWAAANHVKPPEFVIAAAEKEKADKRQESAAVASCCQKKPKAVPACCQQETVPVASASCCQKAETASVAKKSNSSPSCCDSQPTGEAVDEAADSDESESSTVIGWFAQKCQGKGGPIWSSMPWADGLTERPNLPAPLLNEWALPASCASCGRVADPPEPPPRLAAC